MALNAGLRLGPYEILGPLGVGGMGEVYRARDTRLGREVALKLLSPALSADPARRARFEQEARAVAALNHPGIVAVHDIGSSGDGVPYMVSELVDGVTLRQALSPGPMTARKAVELGAEIADALAAAHSRGITHRDLKPDNIMVTRDGRAKVLDFGLAKTTAIKIGEQDATLTAILATDPGTVMGTVGYMSPEQVRGQESDARSDIFSFGAVLHEMLSGQRAFARESAAETMTAIAREDPADLPETVPSGLRQLTRHCLEKEPGQRFQSMKDLAFGLRTMGLNTTSSPNVTVVGAGAAASPPAMGPPFGSRCFRIVGRPAAGAARRDHRTQPQSHANRSGGGERDEPDVFAGRQVHRLRSRQGKEPTVDGSSPGNWPVNGFGGGDFFLRRIRVPIVLVHRWGPNLFLPAYSGEFGEREPLPLHEAYS